MLFSWFRTRNTYTPVPDSPCLTAPQSTPAPTPYPRQLAYNSRPTTPRWMRNDPAKTPEFARPKPRQHADAEAFALPPPLHAEADTITALQDAEAEARDAARTLAAEVARMNLVAAHHEVPATTLRRSDTVRANPPLIYARRPITRGASLRAERRMERPERRYTDGMTLPDGAHYVGELRHGEPDGQGTRIGRRSRYTGQFRQGVPNGMGVKRTTSGVRLEGNFRNGVLDGIGTRVSATERYDGMFRNGLPDGQGVRVFFNTQVRYEGGFRNGKYDGQGRRVTTESSYEGAYCDGVEHGLGTERFFDGEKTVGYYDQGRLVKVLSHRPANQTRPKTAATEPKEVKQEMVGEEGVEPPTSAV